jgi:hypothetical protein
MGKHEKYIINLKKNNKSKDIIAFSYVDAINHIKLIDSENTDIRIYNEDEKLVYSKVYKKSKEINQESRAKQINQHYRYYNNLVTGEKREEKHEEEDDDSYA